VLTLGLCSLQFWRVPPMRKCSYNFPPFHSFLLCLPFHPPTPVPYITLQGNKRLASLPTGVEQCSNLRVCFFQDTSVSLLPEGMASLAKLERLIVPKTGMGDSSEAGTTAPHIHIAIVCPHARGLCVAGFESYVFRDAACIRSLLCLCAHFFVSYVISLLCPRTRPLSRSNFEP
jgi:hypothetical protein